MKVLQIVPKLTPDVCGVGDYSLAIARKWRDYHGIITRFLVTQPRRYSGHTVDGFEVDVLTARTSTSLKKAVTNIPCQAVVLHYSGYGYDRRGAPFWLPLGLQSSRTKLVTMFHELYATGSIASGAFWLSPLMRWVARRLSQISLCVVTNRHLSAEWLRRDATVLPVFSNLGEVSDPIPLCERENHLAIFPGQAAVNLNYWAGLDHAVDVLRPNKIFALGRASPCFGHNLSGIPIEQCGILPANEVSARLTRCRYGYLSYHPDFLEKSGVFSAYAAHALCIVLAKFQNCVPDNDDLTRKGIVAIPKLSSTDGLSAIAMNAHRSYSAHSLEATADMFARTLRNALG